MEAEWRVIALVVLYMQLAGTRHKSNVGEEAGEE